MPSANMENPKNVANPLAPAKTSVVVGIYLAPDSGIRNPESE
jgi:hypothetical protein